MKQKIWDEYALAGLPLRERLDKCTHLIKTSKRKPQRWIAIYAAGEICYVLEKDDPMRLEIGELMVYVIKHEKDDVVKHEACFQLGLRNFDNHVDVLLDVAIHHRHHRISQHEAIEALGLLRTKEEYIIKSLKALALADDDVVRVSAKFVLELLDFLKDAGEYRGGKV